jgi:hypothetical protein
MNGGSPWAGVFRQARKVLTAEYGVKTVIPERGETVSLT